MRRSSIGLRSNLQRTIPPYAEGFVCRTANFFGDVSHITAWRVYSRREIVTAI